MKDKIFKRKLEDRIRRFEKRKEMICIRGARQVGKTTLLKIIAGSMEGNKTFVNMDLADNRRALEENPLDFAKRFKKSGKRSFMFLDEIQRVKDGGEKLKIIFDEMPDVKMFISGSSSLELKTNILPFLVGRMFLYNLMTFDFEESLLAKDKGLARVFKEKHESLRGFLEGNDDIASQSFTSELLEHWKDHVIFGGYPEVVKSVSEEEKTTILKNIFNLYLEKDIMAFFKVEETSKLEDLLKSLAFSISGMLSVSSMASDLKMPYRTIDEFLEILQHTYIIHLLKPFHRNLVTELKKSPKVFFLDTGLRNSVIGNFSPFDNRSDRGSIMENFVLKELVSNFSNWKLNYWRTTGKAEVDFVLRKGKEIVPIEVKLGGEKLGKSFYSFLNSYIPERAIVATLDKFGKQKINKTTVYWVPAFYF